MTNYEITIHLASDVPKVHNKLHEYKTKKPKSKATTKVFKKL